MYRNSFRYFTRDSSTNIFKHYFKNPKIPLEIYILIPLENYARFFFSKTFAGILPKTFLWIPPEIPQVISPVNHLKIRPEFLQELLHKVFYELYLKLLHGSF